MTTRDTGTGILLDIRARPIIAHRGASADAPENTLAAFRLAIEQGADALEMDVHLSADGVPVVIHDPTLDRTTDRRGRVDACTFRELRSVDASARFDGAAARGERIPSLAEVLDATGEMPLTLEIKTPRAQEAVANDLRRTSGLRGCVVASMEHAAVRRLRGACAIGASRRELLRLGARLLVTRGMAPPPYGVIFLPQRYYGVRLPPRRFIDAAHPLGVPVHIWTVNDPEVARGLWAEGVNGMVTDRPGVMRAVRDGLEPIQLDA